MIDENEELLMRLCIERVWKALNGNLETPEGQREISNRIHNKRTKDKEIENPTSTLESEESATDGDTSTHPTCTPVEDEYQPQNNGFDP